MASSLISQNKTLCGSRLVLNEYSNLSTDTQANVLYSIAANPNSVVRANQISTQLKGEDSSRPIQQWLLGNEKIAQIKIATNLMLEFFINTELTITNP